MRSALVVGVAVYVAACVSAAAPTPPQAITSRSGDSALKLYRGRNGVLTVINQGATALTFSLSVGYLNADGQCFKGEIDCETIIGGARGSNGRYELQDVVVPNSGFTIEAIPDAVNVSNVHGDLETGSANRDIVDKVGGRYTASGDAKFKAYRGQNGILTAINQTANAAIISLSVGNFNLDGNCEGEIACETIIGPAQGSNGRYVFLDLLHAPSSGFTITFKNDSADVSDVFDTFGTGTPDIKTRIVGRYTATAR